MFPLCYRSSNEYLSREGTARKERLTKVLGDDIIDVHGRAQQQIAEANLPVVVLVDGAFDAGSGVRMMRRTIRSEMDVIPLAEFDSDLLIDHRARRPHITFENGTFKDYRAPRLGVDIVTDELGNQAILLCGSEPVIAWERVVMAVTDLLESVGSNEVSVVHSMPLPVPHTRPVVVREHGDSGGLESGPFRLPASFSHLLETRLTEHGFNVKGMTIQVPHYIAESDYPAAAVAGLDAIAAHAGISAPSEQLRELGRAVDAQIEEQLHNNTEATTMIEGLEKRYDMETPLLRSSTALAEDESELPDGDQIAAAAQKYLSNVSDAFVEDAETLDQLEAGPQTSEAGPHTSGEHSDGGGQHTGAAGEHTDVTDQQAGEQADDE